MTVTISKISLLVTSIFLITIGFYGIVVSKQYGCDQGTFIKLYKSDNILQSLYPARYECILNFIECGIKDDTSKEICRGQLAYCEDSKSTAGLSSFAKCMSDIQKNDEKKKKSNHEVINEIDRCLNDNSNGSFKCMEGGLFTLSIISVVIGLLMLALSGFLLFKNY